MVGGPLAPPPVKLTLFDVEQNDHETTALADRGPSPLRADAVRSEVGATEFIKPVTLEVSSDRAVWSQIARGSIFATRSGVRMTRLHFAPSDRRYWRFRFDDRLGPPIKVAQVVVGLSAPQSGRRRGSSASRSRQSRRQFVGIGVFHGAAEQEPPGERPPRGRDRCRVRAPSACFRTRVVSRRSVATAARRRRHRTLGGRRRSSRSPLERAHARSISRSRIDRRRWRPSSRRDRRGRRLGARPSLARCARARSPSSFTVRARA